jgi:MarR family transcriptional regulator, organic hydroperoxide resistance regulator
MATSPKVRASTRATPAGEAWQLMHRLFGVHKRRLMALCQEFELAPQQLIALRMLDPDAPSPMSSLADQLHCDNSNVTGIVDRLEARGLVARRSADHDRRVKMLVLTTEGAVVREQLAERFDEPPEQVASLSQSDQRALRDLLRKAFDE